MKNDPNTYTVNFGIRGLRTFASLKFIVSQGLTRRVVKDDKVTKHIIIDAIAEIYNVVSEDVMLYKMEIHGI